MTGDDLDTDRAPDRLSRVGRIGLWFHRVLDNRLSPLGVWAFRRTRGGIARRWGADVLALTTTGRRSGRDRTVLLQYFPDGDTMIVVAANGGGANHPGWYHNLRAEPLASVEIDGRTQAVQAAELPTGDARCWWPRIVATDPGYGRYQRATDRRIPVLRLTPEPDRSAPR